MNETLDDFLGGKVQAWQPAEGFRAGTDTVILAASIAAKPGDRVLELGTGSGVGLLCLGARIENLELFGVDIIESNASRAQRNLAQAKLKGSALHANIFASQHEMLKGQYDHVFMNPPFYKPSAHTKPQDNSRSSAHILSEELEAWVQAAIRRVRPQGFMTMIFPTEGLPQILKAIPDNNAIRTRPIAARADRSPKRLLIQVQTQRKAPFALLPALILNDQRGENSVLSEAIARDMAAISW